MKLNQNWDSASVLKELNCHVLMQFSFLILSDISTNCIDMTSCTLASNEDFKFNCTANDSVPKLFINGTEIKQSGGQYNQYGVTVNAGVNSIYGNIPASLNQSSLTVYCADSRTTFSRNVTLNWNIGIVYNYILVDPLHFNCT